MSRTSSRGPERRRCIYCLQEKGVDEFNEEHVSNEAFGRFNPPVVVHCVCKVCNQEFGDSFDRKIARDSPASLARVKELALPAPSNKGEGKRTTTVLRYSTGPWKGALARHRAGFQGELPPAAFERLVLEPLPQIGFKPDGGGDYEWYLVDDLPTLDELAVRLRAKKGDAIRAYPLSLTPPAAIAALESKGWANLTREAAERPGEESIGADALFELGPLYFRAVTKMALSYVAFAQRAEVACLPQFDIARRFVRKGIEPEPPLVHTCLNTWEPDPEARGHYLAVQTYGAQGVVAQVCLFLELRHIIYLARGGPALPAEFACGHFLDLRSMTAAPSLPPPIPRDSPPSIGGRYATRLTILR